MTDQITDTKNFTGDFLVWRRVGSGLRKGEPGGNGGNPRFRHPTFGSAEAEAHRLAGLFPQSSFVILQEIARIKVKEAANG